MNEIATEDLAKHLNDKYQGTNTKTKPQKQMTDEVRANTIRTMLKKSSLKIGVGPFSTEYTNRVEKILTEKGIINKNEHKNIRTQRTIKALVKSWSSKN